MISSSILVPWPLYFQKIIFIPPSSVCKQLSLQQPIHVDLETVITSFGISFDSSVINPVLYGKLKYNKKHIFHPILLLCEFCVKEWHSESLLLAEFYCLLIIVVNLFYGEDGGVPIYFICFLLS